MGTKKVKIVYYSGTGGTEKVANCFENTFKEEGYEVNAYRLFKDAEIPDTEHDLLLLLYPVYALNAPSAVYKWIEGMENVNNHSAVVISVSGGGEVSPNTGCRTGSIKRLEKKGYKVIYEKMIVMPSNVIVAVKEPLAQMLMEILPVKAKQCVDDIGRGIIKRTNPHMIDRFFSGIGKYEKHGAIYFGKHIKVLETCNGCGWCSRSCPSNNITMKSNRPEFGNKCHLCLNCIYGCPNKALAPGIGKFIVIKEGYSFKKLEELGPCTEKVDVDELTKGYLWSGIRKYLSECD